MQTPTNEILASAKRTMLFLVPPHDTEAEREAAMQRAAKLMLEATTALIRAGRDDLAFRAAELATDVR